MMSAQAPVMKPQPRVNEVSQPFWEGVNEGRIRLQRCTKQGCGHTVFYPRVCCPHCREAGLEWFDASGEGRVVSHTTIYRSHHDGFNQDLPYVFGAIELVEGVILYAQLPDAPADGQSLLGRTVKALFEPHGPGRKIVMFQLTEA